jgi:hypothetical protein
VLVVFAPHLPFGPVTRDAFLDGKQAQRDLLAALDGQFERARGQFLAFGSSRFGGHHRPFPPVGTGVI